MICSFIWRTGPLSIMIKTGSYEIFPLRIILFFELSPKKYCGSKAKNSLVQKTSYKTPLVPSYDITTCGSFIAVFTFYIIFILLKFVTAMILSIYSSLKSRKTPTAINFTNISHVDRYRTKSTKKCDEKSTGGSSLLYNVN